MLQRHTRKEQIDRAILQTEAVILTYSVCLLPVPLGKPVHWLLIVITILIGTALTYKGLRWFLGKRGIAVDRIKQNQRLIAEISVVMVILIIGVVLSFKHHGGYTAGHLLLLLAVIASLACLACEYVIYSRDEATNSQQQMAAEKGESHEVLS